MAKELGVEIITEAHVNDFKKVGKQVKAVVLDGGKEIEVDKLVIAAGYRSKELAAKLGWSLPLWPVKGYSINYDWEY